MQTFVKGKLHVIILSSITRFSAFFGAVTRLVSVRSVFLQMFAYQ